MPSIVELCPLKEDHTQLSADWFPDGFVPKAVLVIETWETVHYWRITVCEVGDATGSGRHVLLTPWNENSQRFVIPPNILESGARYEITAEGLKLSEDGFDSLDFFRLTCRRCVTLETSAKQGRPIHYVVYTHMYRPMRFSCLCRAAIKTNQ